ncbi:hypothetical protein [Streptomyces sp. NPDC047968]|uniref:hypothetical protein n=1 Tax=unclassified Streptomyces TaxID=2593676 RepID=UPI00343FFB6B
MARRVAEALRRPEPSRIRADHSQAGVCGSDGASSNGNTGLQQADIDSLHGMSMNYLHKEAQHVSEPVIGGLAASHQATVHPV